MEIRPIETCCEPVPAAPPDEALAPGEERAAARR